MGSRWAPPSLRVESAAARSELVWTDRAAVAESLVDDQRAFMRRGFDDTRVRAIPDAALLPSDGVGHELPPPTDWDLVVTALLQHTSGRS